MPYPENPKIDILIRSAKWSPLAFLFSLLVPIAGINSAEAASITYSAAQDYAVAVSRKDKAEVHIVQPAQKRVERLPKFDPALGTLTAVQMNIVLAGGGELVSHCFIGCAGYSSTARFFDGVELGLTFDELGIDFDRDVNLKHTLNASRYDPICLVYACEDKKVWNDQTVFTGNIVPENFDAFTGKDEWINFYFRNSRNTYLDLDHQATPGIGKNAYEACIDDCDEVFSILSIYLLAVSEGHVAFFNDSHALFYGSRSFSLTYDYEPNISVVPIPPAIPLFASGLLALGYIAKRRKRKAADS
ncbi:MAG: hypothetical protein NXI13_17330 [Proteobacteria bacterium]|nr:hypothetical protein [Pseudomonadota bacterium]